jgi:hypothetical protein
MIRNPVDNERRLRAEPNESSEVYFREAGKSRIATMRSIIVRTLN